MTKLKDKTQISLSAFMICNIADCKEEAAKLLSTETNIIDVCEKHYNLLGGRS